MTNAFRLALCGIVASTSLCALAEDSERTKLARQELEQRRRAGRIEAGQRHLEIGVWCRDVGLVPQATAEFLRAVEVSDHANPGAERVLSLMRRFDERFWKERAKHPSKALLDGYDRRARGATLDDQKEWLALARLATKLGLADEARVEYLALLRGLDRPLELDAKGRIVVEAGALPDEISARLRDEAVTIDGRLWLRDECLARVPAVKEIFEAESPELRVRTQRSAAASADLLALARAMLPYLEDETDGRPTRRMTVYVFDSRRTWEAYLAGGGLTSHRLATGIAESTSFAAVVCAEGLSDARLRGAVVHEMSHLYQMGVTPVVMPSWYAEGFAETFGGDGTFAWDGKKLDAKRAMSASRLEPLKTALGFIPLDVLLGADALAEIGKGGDAANRFYAESWALRRYLQTDAPKPIVARFALWETMCRGQAIGAEPGKPNSRNFGPAAELFRKMLGPDLPTIESGFREWLQSD
jgi:hypothetical protein